MSADTRQSQPIPPATASSPVKRLRRQRWSDPRLLIGLLIVAGSVVTGSRVMAAADDTTQVWAIRDDHRAGTRVSPGDVREVDVRLTGEGAERYVPAERPIEAGRVWARDVHAGELLGVAATRPAGEPAVGQLPLIVPVGALPSDLAAGDRVDVWAIDTDTSKPRGRARMVLDSMRVLSVAGPPSAMGRASGHRVLLALDEEDPDTLSTALAAIGGGQVTLVREVTRGAS